MHSWFWNYDIAIIGTALVLIVGWLVSWAAGRIIDRHERDHKESYRHRQTVNTVVVVAAITLVGILWARKLQHTGTFLGLVGAGLAIALREPLLSVAGRIAIFAGNMYRVGDRIEIEKMSGDVIDVGFFYTRMMEIGNWIGGDQYSGRIIQFANAKIFGAAVFNYTRNFAYIWDEVKLPITYDSNLQAARDMLMQAGGEYSKEFLEGAHAEVEHMQRVFLVANFELKPQAYVEVTDNYVVLTMRYLVDPRQRRTARSFIFNAVFEKMQHRDDIQIGSSTMDVTVQPAKGQTPLMIAERPPDGQKSPDGQKAA